MPGSGFFSHGMIRGIQKKKSIGNFILGIAIFCFVLYNMKKHIRKEDPSYEEAYCKKEQRMYGLS